jgi:hypothetical protein
MLHIGAQLFAVQILFKLFFEHIVPVLSALACMLLVLDMLVVKGRGSTGHLSQ